MLTPPSPERCPGGICPVPSAPSTANMPTARQWSVRPFCRPPPEQSGRKQNMTLLQNCEVTAMYLSRIELDLARPTTMQALVAPQKLHGAVESAFAG